MASRITLSDGIYDPDAKFSEEEIEVFFRECYSDGLRLKIEPARARIIARHLANSLRDS